MTAVEIMRKLVFYHDVHTPVVGEPKGEFFVKFHGVISDKEFAELNEWLGKETGEEQANSD